MKARIILAVGFITLLAVMSGYGQQLSLKATIDFPFTAGGKALPAGQYEFSRDSTLQVFKVIGEGKTHAVVPILTSLALQTHSSADNAYLVFDKVGEACSLSEIWIPGTDGFLVLATKGKHEHKVVTVKY
jgi:hypothetical protein